MRVGVEKTNLQELHEEALLSDADELANLLFGAIGQLNAVDPLRDEDSPRAQIVVHLRNIHPFDFLLVHDQLPASALVLRFVREIKLGVKANRPFVQERDVIRALLRREPLDQTLVHLRGSPQDVQVFRHGAQDLRALHLHRDVRVRARQPRAVHLRQTRRGDGLLGDFVEEVAEGPAQLALDRVDRDGGLERLHRVL